ncbi:DUF1919 domain-containing protein [Peribacillus frigoritolerans]|uniref:DUF1919 domain-containing protein n=1 Tax=Peribacillus castrilensis TaxID=2897690 RepID=UPI003D2BC318
MASLEGVKLKIRKKYIEKTAKIRKKSLKVRDFTIISNNCWGGFIYQSYEISYNSPTIGLYFMADDYLKFVADLPKYLITDLEFVDPESSIYYDQLKNDKVFGSYPISKLNDIEIIFLHYKSKEEAFEKWTRRCKRINWDKMLVKFNDQNGCTEEHLNIFEKLPIKNKICFTSKEYKNLNSTIFIESASKQKSVNASQEPFGNSKYINLNKLLDSL